MRSATIDIYQDRRGDWRWRLRSSNGRIIADSAESYVKKGNVQRAVRALKVLLFNMRPVRVVCCD